MTSDIMEKRMQGYTKALRQAGVRLTHQRLEIFRYLASSVEHPDAEAVYGAVRGRVPTVSLDTVYRTLWLLRDLGQISTLGPRRDSVRFDGNLEPHHHFICERCGMARDFANPAYDALGVPKPARELGTVVSAQVQLIGICRACMREQAEESAKNIAGETPAKGRREVWRKKRRS